MSRSGGEAPAPPEPPEPGEPGEPWTSRASGASGASGRRWAVLSVQLLLTALVTWFIADRVGLSLEELSRIDPARWTPRLGWLLLSCLVLLGGYGMSGALWGLMVRDMGGPRLPLGTSVRTFLVANLGRYIPGKVWQIAGLAYLARQKEVPARIATAAAVLGQAVALAAAALVGVGALLDGSGATRRTGLWVLGGVVAVLGLALVPPVLRRLLALWFRLARTEPPEELRPRPGLVLRWLALYGLNWIVYAFAFSLFVMSFDLPGGFVRTGSAFAAAYVLGYAALFAPAGLGVREGFLTVFLGPVMGVATAGTLAVMARLWTTAVEIVPAGVLWGRHLGRSARPGAPE